MKILAMFFLMYVVFLAQHVQAEYHANCNNHGDIPCICNGTHCDICATKGTVIGNPEILINSQEAAERVCPWLCTTIMDGAPHCWNGQWSCDPGTASPVCGSKGHCVCGCGS